MTLRIACSALGKRIFAGHLTKDGTRFREPRHDVTSDVLKAVIDKIEIGNEAEVSDGENIVARIAVLPPIAAPVAETAGEAIEDLWQELCERDDRTSPEEYPEMCLINFDELSDFITRAAPPVPAQDDDRVLKPNLFWSAEGWEYTHSDLTEAYEEATGGTNSGVVKIGNALELPAIWAVQIDIDTTGDGEADDYEIKTFPTKEEADAYLADALKSTAAKEGGEA